MVRTGMKTPRSGKVDPASRPVVLITGAARGIGKAIALTFGQAGFTVIVCDVNRAGGEACALQLNRAGIPAHFLAANLARGNAAANIVGKVVSRYGRLDVLVNNARAARAAPGTQGSERQWDAEIAVTLRAASFAGRAAISAMAKTGGGSIVNIGSVASFVATPDPIAYQVAKSGLLQLTRCLAMEGGPSAVRVNAVLPGFIVQDEHRSRYDHASNKRYRELAEFSHPLRTVGSSKDVADAVLFLASSGSRFITGQSIVVDGGLTIQDPSALLYAFDFGTSRS